LVAALKAADLVTTLSGKGPFKVFAPINAAFDKIPADLKASNGVIHVTDAVSMPK